MFQDRRITYWNVLKWEDIWHFEMSHCEWSTISGRGGRKNWTWSQLIQGAMETLRALYLVSTVVT